MKKKLKIETKFRSPINAIYGVLPISIYTKPYACGGSCIYCPTDKKIPKSYLENQDTAFALSVDYCPKKQFKNRLAQILSSNKLDNNMPFEIIILGGSFSSFPHEYRISFISALYESMGEINILDKYSQKNCDFDNIRHRCSVLTVESRPDQINENECEFLRQLGVTKVEMGVQSTNDGVLNYVKRGHIQLEIVNATKLLKDNGFKVGYHLMIGLPNSSLEIDKKMLGKDIWKKKYNPDYIKVYPCILLKNAIKTQKHLYKLWKENNWSPPTEDYSIECLNTLCNNIPNYVRVSRIQRQFEDNEVVDSVKMGLRRRLKQKLYDLREREVGKRKNINLINFKYLQFNIINRWSDYYIEAIDPQTNTLYGLLRLRKNQNNNFIIREIKVYGQASPVGTKGQVQGNGLGEKLLTMAESIAIKNKQHIIKVNAAVGAKSFFYKNGFDTSEKHFMIKLI